MTKSNDFQIDLEIHKLELEGIDKILDIIKLTVSIGTPACALLLSQGMENWWQWVAFSVLFGVVLGAFVELFNQAGARNEILSEMKTKYLNEQHKPKGIIRRFASKRGSV